MAKLSAVRERISAEAIDWFVRFQNSAGTSADRLELSEWLLRSPIHIEEYLALSKIWGALSLPTDGEFHIAALIADACQRDESSNVVGLCAGPATVETPVRKPPEGISRTGWAAIAATVVLGAVLWFGYQVRHGGSNYETVVGEQRSVTLTDGSVVYLNTNSSMRVRWTAAERHIDLLRGEARFQVAKNPARPFIVATNEATVRAVGTIFNVRADQTVTQVAVIVGRVEVKALPEERGRDLRVAAAALSGAGPNLQLTAGEHAEVTLGAIKPNAGPSVETVSAWTERRLVFRDESLATVVGEFNRYRNHPLVLDDAELGALKISGAFDLDDPDSLTSYLKSFEAVRVEREEDGSQHVSREPASTKSIH